VVDEISGFVSLITQRATWTRSSGSQVVGQVALRGQNCSSAGFSNSDSHLDAHGGLSFRNCQLSGIKANTSSLSASHLNA